MKRIMTVLSFAALISSCGRDRGYTSLNNEDFRSRIAAPEVQLVDVRTPREFDEGHIAAAKNMDVQSPDFDSLVMSLDRRRPVAVYCRSGRRSKVAAKRMSDAGLEVYELDNGITGWDGPVVR